jgi:hypothetical protein
MNRALSNIKALFYPEDGSNAFFKNVHDLISGYVRLHSRRNDFS